MKYFVNNKTLLYSLAIEAEW